MEDMSEIPEPWYKGPIKYILGVFLIFLIVLWVVPIYGVQLDPEPSNVPSLSDLGDFNAEMIESDEIVDYIVDDAKIKNAATYIAAQGCESGEKICQAKALFYFVRDEIDYVSDPIDKEYWESASTVLANGGGDCESGAILLANLLEAIGVNAQMVFVPGHAYLRIFLPDAARRYKQDGWVHLDWTCSNCEFGEISFTYRDVEKRFVDV